MKLWLAKGFCGMTPQQGSVVGGLYFLMVAVMQIVFDVGSLQDSMESQTFGGDQSATTGHLIPPSCIVYSYILLAMISTTVLLILCMLGAVWAQHPVCILGFAVWLTMYDVGLLIVNSLMEVQMRSEELTLCPLAWFFVVWRWILDPLWLSLVITHGLEVQESKRLKRSKRLFGAIEEGPRPKMKF